MIIFVNTFLDEVWRFVLKLLEGRQIVSRLFHTV